MGARLRRRALAILGVVVAAGAVTVAACKTRPMDGSGSAVVKADQAPAAGTPDFYRPGNRLVSPGADAFVDEIQPILAEKCVSCHACSEAPCQLKLDGMAGILRGATAIDAYASRVKAVEHTGNEHRFDPAGWQKRGFWPVTQGGDNSLLAKAIAAGANHQPGADLGPASADHTWTCPADSAAYAQFLQATPKGGMPWGITRLGDDEAAKLTAWLGRGAPGPSAEVAARLATPTRPEVVERWEKFFYTGPEDVGYGNHVDLVGRYIYEHAFLAHLHFEESPGEFFQLVRSRRPPGQPLDEIFTPVPTDAPGITSRVYYRLKKISGVIPRKNHVVWRLSDRHLKFYGDLFFRQQKWWTGATKVPGYGELNPFATFAAIPAKIRYQWLLDNTKLLVDQMTRGPVCVGNRATYVIDDHFWGWALDPDSDPSVWDPTLGLGSDFRHLAIKESEDTAKYRKAWEATLRKHLAKRGRKGLAVDDIWDGRKGSPYPNPNAWLTILRHETNATVQNGPRGGFPPSIWVISFSHLERLYYDLVVSFDAYGSIKHKLSTWNFMDHIRVEGEDLFISFMPEDQRRKIRLEYNSGLIGKAKLWQMGETSVVSDLLVKVGLANTTMYAEGRPAGTAGVLTPQIMASRVAERMGTEVTGPPTDPLNRYPDNDTNWTVPAQIGDVATLETGLRTIAHTQKWGHARFFPNISYMRVKVGGEELLYSVLATRGYDSHSSKYAEKLTRVPEEDTLMILRGMVGNYPALFLDIPEGRAAEALTRLQTAKTDADWQGLLKDFAVGRNTEAFWPFVRWLTRWQERNDPIDGGIVELREYQYQAL